MRDKYAGHTPGPWERGANGEIGARQGLRVRIPNRQGLPPGERSQRRTDRRRPTLLAQRDALAEALREVRPYLSELHTETVDIALATLDAE